MSLRSIILVFLFTVTGLAILELAEATTRPLADNVNKYVNVVTKIMDDQCGPYGFFNCFDGRCSCYLVLPGKTNYNQASKHCQHFQGQLTALSSQEENDFVASLLKRTGINDAWIGLNKTDSSAEFEWADKSAVSYSALKKDGQKGSCVRLSSKKEWVPSDCTRNNVPFVCEVPYESTEKKTTCRPGWAKFGNHCYQLHKELRSWDDAQKRCKCMEADLVSIHSVEENDFTLEMMTMSNLPVIWIGFRMDVKTKKFNWVDGSVSDFTHWRPNQPDFYQSNEECGETRTEYRRWNDLPCWTKLHYMCKTDLLA